jgi:CRISPR-associated endonuclease/helicase Cas3
MLAEHVRGWFPAALAVRPEDALPDSTRFQHAFSGLVMLADWLGSDRDHFRFREPGPGDRIDFARDKARRAVSLIGLDLEQARASLQPDASPFDLVSEYSPRPAQRRLLQSVLAGDRESLVVLEAETGSGKTEAALAHFVRLFRAGQVDGMTFALPTRTAATQIFERIRKAIQRAFSHTEHPPVCVLAVPGYLAVDDRTGKRLPGFEVLWNDDEDRRFRYRGWAAENPKRFLAGSIVVGTIDQVLLSTLMVGHAHLRATALLRHLLVVDEVHASDAYMTRLLEEVLSFHLASGGHALLMSATLGAEAKHRLLQAASGTFELPPLAEASLVPYPLIRTASGLLAVETEGPGKTIRVDLEAWQDRPETLVQAALRAAQAGARVLVLRNTVRACLQTQLALENLAPGSDLLFRCKTFPAPHHARYAKVDREALDEAIEAAFGQTRPAGGCVAVATQTVQQSLDLDADFMVTDLCPMDVLLQRMGRLHRHKRTRPDGFHKARCTVLVPSEADLGHFIRADGEPRAEAGSMGAPGIGTVYEDLRILEATWRELESTGTLEIPAMNRRLVEAATHPEALRQVVERLGGLWLKHDQWVQGQFYGDRRHGDLNVVRRDQPFGPYSFPPKELKGRVQTRLGEGDRLMDFERPVPAAFGGTFRQLTVPEYLARDVPTDAKPVVTAELGGGGLELEWGGRRFRYDRLGLRTAESVEAEEPET